MKVAVAVVEEDECGSSRDDVCSPLRPFLFV